MGEVDDNSMEMDIDVIRFLACGGTDDRIREAIPV